MLQLLFWRWLQPNTFILFYLAIIVASLFQGWYGGLAATFFSSIAATSFFLTPSLKITVAGTNGFAPMVVFVIIGIAISILSEILLRAQRRLVELQFEMRAEQEFREIFNSSPYAVLAVIDENGVIIRINSQVEKIFGYQPKELIGHPIEVLVPERYQKEHLNLVKEYMKSPKPRLLGSGRDLLGQRQNGSEIPLEIALNPIKVRGKSVILVTLMDISVRKQAEQELSRFASIIASSGDAIIGETKAGVITSWNAGAERLFGYSAVEAVGQHISLLSPADRPDEIPGLMEKLLNGELIEHYETVRLTKKGSKVNVSLSLSPIKDKYGSIIGVSKIARDITARKRAEEALRYNEHRYRSLFENMMDGFAHCEMIFDSSGRPVDFIYLEVNHSFERLTGLKNMVGKRMTEAFPGIRDSVPELIEIFGKVAITGNAERFEFYFKPLEIWLLISVYSFERGHFVTLFDDITERKRSEENLRRNALTLRQVGQMANLGAWYLEIVNSDDINANPLVWSEETYHVFGFKPGEIEVYNELFFQRVHPEDREKLSEALTDAINKKHPYSIDHRITRADGIERIIAEHAEIVYGKEGKPIRIIGAVQDVTDRKRAEEALKNSEEQFRSLANAIPQLAWIARADGYIYWYNQRWYEYTGTTPKEMEGWGWQSVHHPAELPRVLERWKSSIASGSPFDMVFPIRGANGLFRNFLTRIIPVRNKEGRLVQWFGTNTDIEEQLQTAEEIKNAVAARDEFISVASHELKTPLTSLLMGIQMRERALMRKDSSAFSTEKIAGMLESDKRQLGRLNRLIDDMLDASRINSGRLSLELEQFDICALVTDVTNRYSGLCSQMGVPLKVNVCEPVMGVWDASRMEQVLSNLLSNALKYGDHSPIEVSVRGSGFQVQIRIRDEGRGISKEDQDRVFHRFERAVKGRSITGLGLGLYIVKRILDLHGGSIQVESELGKGSTFIIDLPIHQEWKQWKSTA